MTLKGGVFLLLLAALSSLAQSPTPDDLRKEAEAAETKGDIVRAYVLFAQAAAADPSDKLSWAHSLALRRRATLAANILPQVELATGAEALKAAYKPEFLSDTDLAELKKLRPPPELQIQNPQQARDFSLEGDSRFVWEQFAQAWGYDVVFDGDYQPLPNVRFRIEDLDYDDALIALEHATSSFVVPVSERLGMVASETQQKRQELEHNIAVTVPLPPPVTAQEAQELAQAVQQVMELQRFTVDARMRMAVIRGPATSVLPAQLLFEQLLHYRPDVAIEVRILEVSQSSEYRYGTNLQTSFPLVWLSSLWGNQPSIPTGFMNFLTFGGGKTLFGLGVLGAEVFARFTDSTANTLMEAQMRTSSGATARFHVGDRYPIITAGYFGVPGADPNSDDDVFTPPPTVSFEDLGLQLEITPFVHSVDEISVGVEGNFKVLTGRSLNGIPVISSREYTSQARLRNGEWAILAGLVSNTEARTISGIAGLSTLPVLGPLFRNNTTTNRDTSALIAIRPRLLSDPPSEIATRMIWTGSETRPRSGVRTSP